ncbi:hypothetical protein EMPS_00649 [Entomortierella parvispora]|uniref:Uncharacterized protein n=1 Tax=Entomortierella parvispora TaxID=205924 RepID=A0A9P3LRV0_9FUNG|nr:hypothetical protein EMPS_00649 [Entomortierella parvispora]
MPDQVLTEENLALHTEHHKKLVQKRDFVAEFIQQLVPTSLPRVNPIREARLSDEGVAILRHVQPKTKEQQPTASPLQEQSAIPTANAKLVVKKKRRVRKETPTTLEKQRQVGASALESDDHPAIVYKGKGKRRSPSDAIELDVGNLAIDDVADAKAYSTQARQGPSVETWPDHDDQGDFLQQAVEESLDGHGHLREPLEEHVNESSSNPHHRHRQRHHRHDRHIQRNLDRYESSKVQALQETRIAKPNRNKPRKILTQGSLVMNQFESSKVAKDRITASSTSDIICIRDNSAMKGKASTRVAVSKDRGFSESSFLNRRDDSRHDDSRPEPIEIITSSYFDPKESRTGTEDVMTFNRSGSKESSSSIRNGERDSNCSLGKGRKRQASCDSDLDHHIAKKRGGHQKCNDSMSRASWDDQASWSSPESTRETAFVAHEQQESVDGVVGYESMDSNHGLQLPLQVDETHARGNHGASAVPLTFESTEPAIYYYETPQDYIQYGAVDRPYPTPMDCPPDSMLVPAFWADIWPSQVAEQQYAPISDKDSRPPAERINEKDYFPEDPEDVAIRACSQPPRVQFNWRPRRLY